ncbi:MAG TPA: glycoside hydrolase family 97 N-terminal domain-containing protein, partial [Chitinophagaceae bacterium]|nr:glycoside hydrolase family 97 N-terminal domain-containing protein [Chitinophagaceae bacterium]
MALKINFTLCVLLLAAFLFAQKEVRLTSPDGNIVFTLQLNKAVPEYSIAFKKNVLIKNSTLNLVFEDKGPIKIFGSNQAPVFTEVNENYDLVVGKAKRVNNHYKQLTISLQAIKGYHVN